MRVKHLTRRLHLHAGWGIFNCQSLVPFQRQLTLTGNYDENHWSADLKIVAGHDVPEFLLNLIDAQMRQAVDLTRRIDDTGGAVTVFIGVFAVRLCDFEIPASTLRRLGDGGISVRLDYYGVGNDQSHDATEQSGERVPPVGLDVKS